MLTNNFDACPWNRHKIGQADNVYEKQGLEREEQIEK